MHRVKLTNTKIFRYSKIHFRWIMSRLSNWIACYFISAISNFAWNFVLKQGLNPKFSKNFYNEEYFLVFLCGLVFCSVSGKKCQFSLSKLRAIVSYILYLSWMWKVLLDFHFQTWLINLQYVCSNFQQ